jgi:prepilin signal peptidase PulO-like enzyme (type II secretory pathway)
VISFIDIRYRRIPNLLVLAVLFAAIIENRPDFDSQFFLASSLCIALFSVLSRCGYGDTKLSLVIVNAIIGKVLIFEYLFYVIVISSISIAIHLLRHRGIKADIAFAPALCGAVLGVRILSPL